MVLLRLALRLALSAASLVAATPARACSVCACGDPLVAATEAQGRPGDFRVALDTEYLNQEAASEAGTGRDVLDQYTLRITGVYSPVAPLNVVLGVPLMRKRMHVKGADAATSDLLGLGDVEIGARYFFLERVNFGARRRQGFALSLGSTLPTGSNDAKADGERVDEHGQLGTGAFGPYAGLAYRFQQDPWSALLSVTGRLRTENGAGYKYGNALLWTAQAQWSPLARLALGLALEGREAGQDRDALGRVDDTGGLVLAATPSAYLEVFRDVWVHVRAQLPFATRLEGEQRVGPTITAGFAYQIL